MIRAVIFDCFGVLATDGWIPFRDQYFKANPGLFGQAVALNKKVDRGLMQYDNFVHTVAGMAGVEDKEAYTRIDDNEPNRPLFTYIQAQIKPHYKLGILSNAGANWLEEIFTPEQVALFDNVTLSYESGYIKPQSEIYHLACQRLGVRPSEAVFIDDNQRFCEAAEELGMQAVWYKNVEQCIQDLTNILSDKQG